MRFFRNFFLTDLSTIVCVILIFHFMANRNLAVALTSFVFFSNALGLAWFGRDRRGVTLVNIFFLLAFVIPLPVFRALDSTNDLVPLWHKAATGFYVLKMFIDAVSFRSAPK